MLVRPNLFRLADLASSPAEGETRKRGERQAAVPRLAATGFVVGFVIEAMTMRWTFGLNGTPKTREIDNCQWIPGNRGRRASR